MTKQREEKQIVHLRFKKSLLQRVDAFANEQEFLMNRSQCIFFLLEQALKQYEIKEEVTPEVTMVEKPKEVLVSVNNIVENKEDAE